MYYVRYGIGTTFSQNIAAQWIVNLDNIIIGFCSFYKRYVKQFASVAGPLHDLVTDFEKLQIIKIHLIINDMNDELN